MSKSLSIQCDPVDQPVATDPVERLTWCSFGARIAGHTITRVWDRALGETRSRLYVPAFPIAEWIVQNWWALLNEPCRTERVPGAGALPALLPWIKRHCLRSADSGTLLPALYFFDDGCGIRAEWQADDPDALPHMPGVFVDSYGVHLDKKATEDALARFVGDVLVRVDSLNDERVKETRANWMAIRNADADETRFCVVCGRLGLDPYDVSEVNDELAEFIGNELGDPDVPLNRDLTEIADAKDIAKQWSWVQSARADLGLGASTGPGSTGDGTAATTAAQRGYKLAKEVRTVAGLDMLSPIHSPLEKLAEQMIGADLRIENRNSVPGRGIRLVVGWSGQGHAVAVGPQADREDNRRFQVARALHHACYSCSESPRLVTDAYTYDQSVSRAFAAELLAPRQALADATGGWPDDPKIEKLAAAYRVSTMVVRRQLENAGVLQMQE